MVLLNGTEKHLVFVRNIVKYNIYLHLYNFFQDFLLDFLLDPLIDFDGFFVFLEFFPFFIFIDGFDLDALVFFL